MATEYPKLAEDEIRRNRWGNNIIFASDEHPLYPFYETLYGKKKKQEVGFLHSSAWLLLTFVPSACTDRPEAQQGTERQRPAEP
jgi:5'-3' exonuclease